MTGEERVRPDEGMPPAEDGARPEQPAAEVQDGQQPVTAARAPGGPAAEEPDAEEREAPDPAPKEDAAGTSERPGAPRRRRDPLASALIGVLTLLLGFAFAVQVRATDTPQQLETAREEDLVRILDELNTQEERLRAQISEQRAALEQLTSSDSQSAAALAEAQEQAEAIGILNGTVAATGPGIRMDISDPADRVPAAILLDAIQELRGAGAETMQIDGVRIGVSTAVTGSPGDLALDGQPVQQPYEFRVIGSPQDMATAMNIPNGVVDKVRLRDGTVDLAPTDRVVVDALRPLDTPQYAEPADGD